MKHKQITLDESELIQHFMFSAILRMRNHGWEKQRALMMSDAIMSYMQSHMAAWREEACDEIVRYLNAGANPVTGHSPEEQVARVVLPCFYASKGFEYADKLNEELQNSHQWN